MIGNLKDTPKKCGIYKIKNIKNGFFYIGSSNNLYSRHKNHRWTLSNGKHKNRLLQSDYDKYGHECFLFEVLEVIDNENSILNIEQKYLDENKNNDKLYNLHVTAGSAKDYVVPKNLYEKTIITKRETHSFGSKLSKEDVIEIKKLLQNGNILQKDIAEMFNVAISVISRIKTGKRWSHITIE